VVAFQVFGNLQVAQAYGMYNRCDVILFQFIPKVCLLRVDQNIAK
jgi:hypothetical protein